MGKRLIYKNKNVAAIFLNCLLPDIKVFRVIACEYTLNKALQQPRLRKSQQNEIKSYPSA